MAASTSGCGGRLGSRSCTHSPTARASSVPDLVSKRTVPSTAAPLSSSTRAAASVPCPHSSSSLVAVNQRSPNRPGSPAGQTTAVAGWFSSAPARAPKSSLGSCSSTSTAAGFPVNGAVANAVDVQQPRGCHAPIIPRPAELTGWQTRAMAGWAMGIYRDQVLPRALDLSMRGAAFARQRAQVTAGLDGEVLEIGFGTGLNVPFYPAAVRRVLAVEPAGGGRSWPPGGWPPGTSRPSPVPVQFAGLDAATLPAADASLDHVLSTWTLCTVPDAARRWPRSAGCCGRAARCTSPSTAWPLTRP